MHQNFDTFLSKMKKLGKRINFSITDKKEAVLKVLYEANQPINAKQIYEIINQNSQTHISITLIYRILNVLEEAYVLHAIVLPPNDTKHYSLLQDKAQSHLVCIKCANVITFHDEITLKAIDKVLEEKAFILSNLKVTLYGVCEECLDE